MRGLSDTLTQVMSEVWRQSNPQRYWAEVFQEGLYRWMTVEEWKDENGAPNDLVAALKVCCCIMTMHRNDSSHHDDAS